VSFLLIAKDALSFQRRLHEAKPMVAKNLETEFSDEEIARRRDDALLSARLLALSRPPRRRQSTITKRPL
jgi:hypothetical protein